MAAPSCSGSKARSGPDGELNRLPASMVRPVPPESPALPAPGQGTAPQAHPQQHRGAGAAGPDPGLVTDPVAQCQAHPAVPRPLPGCPIMREGPCSTWISASAMSAARRSSPCAGSLTWPPPRVVRADNRIHGSDQQSCTPGALAVMITDHVPAVRVRHEALLFRMGVRDRPSPRRRSGEVKLGAA